MSERTTNVTSWGQGDTQTANKLQSGEQIEAFNEVLEALQKDTVDPAHPIETCAISFNGCGDDGYIDEVFATTVTGAGNPLSQETETLIEEWAYDVLDAVGVDWYNNEGGFGTITVLPQEKRYTFEVNINVSESELASSGQVVL